MPTRRSLLLLALVLALSFVSTVDTASVYGTIPPNEYLLGMFNPEKSSLFAPVTSFGLQFNNNYVGYVRVETGKALAAMVGAFNRNYPNITLPVVSATRNYTKQAEIWTNKWYGAYKNITGEVDRALAIMEYSSMPGTSRHHWGSDVDLYSLEDIDFLKGNGKIIYQWLTDNAASYGFCQPYTAGRHACVGYNEEKWHWSYLPLSMPMLSDWFNSYAYDLCAFTSKATFPGSGSAAVLAPAYVATINQLCKSR